MVGNKEVLLNLNTQSKKTCHLWPKDYSTIIPQKKNNTINKIRNLYECLKELDNDINNIHSSMEIETVVVYMIEEVVQTTQVQKIQQWTRYLDEMAQNRGYGFQTEIERVIYKQRCHNR